MSAPEFYVSIFLLCTRISFWGLLRRRNRSMNGTHLTLRLKNSLIRLISATFLSCKPSPIYNTMTSGFKSLSCEVHVHAGYGNFSTEGCIPDPINGSKYVRDLYEKVDDTIGEPFL